MAIYHVNVQVISRKTGRSSVAAAAYRAGNKLENEREGLTYDYTRRTGVIYSEILLPENAPKEYQDRQTLWNAIEKAEKSRNAQLAREINIALPVELNRQEQIKILQEYVQSNFVNAGMCADIAIHNKKDGNPHAHVMLTMRPMDAAGKWENIKEKVYICKNRNGEEKGFTPKELKRQTPGEWEKQMQYFKNGDPSERYVYLTKTQAETDQRFKEYHRVKDKADPKASKKGRENPTIALWNSEQTFEAWRENWAKVCNRAFERNQLTERIDHRSYERQGREQLATIHLGTTAHQLEKRGIKTDRGMYNKEVNNINMAYSKELADVERQVEELKQDVKLLLHEQEQLNRELKNTEKLAIEKTVREQIAKEEQAKNEALQQQERLMQEDRVRQERMKTEERNRREMQEKKKYKPGDIAGRGNDLITQTVYIAESAIYGAVQDAKYIADGISKLSKTSPQLPPAEQIAQKLATLEEKYIDIEYQKIARQAIELERRNVTNQTQGMIADLQKRQGQINDYDKAIYNLTESRASLGVFALREKKEIDQDIERLETSKQQAINALQHAYGITPDEAYKYVQRLQTELTQRMSYYKRDESPQPSHAEQQKAIKAEYTAIVKSINQHPDKETITAAVKNLKYKTQNQDQLIAIYKAKGQLHKTFENVSPTRHKTQEFTH